MATKLPRGVYYYNVTVKKTKSPSITETNKLAVKNKLTSLTAKISEPEYPTRQVEEVDTNMFSLDLRSARYILSQSEVNDLLTDPTIASVAVVEETASFITDPGYPSPSRDDLTIRFDSPLPAFLTSDNFDSSSLILTPTGTVAVVPDGSKTRSFLAGVPLHNIGIGYRLERDSGSSGVQHFFHEWWTGSQQGSYPPGKEGFSQWFANQLSPEQEDIIGDFAIKMTTQRDMNFLYTESGYWITGDYTNVDEYNTSIDGTGVDVIICDQDCPDFDHPELKKSNGLGARKLQLIDWNEVLGLTPDVTGFDPIYTPESGIENNRYYNFEHHGNQMACNIAGNNLGSAPGATLYFMKTNLSSDVGFPTSGRGTNIITCMNMARLFHLSKSIDPSIGVKRPTIMCTSFGLLASSGAGVYANGTADSGNGLWNIYRTNIVTHSFGGKITTYINNVNGDPYQTNGIWPNFDDGKGNLPHYGVRGLSTGTHHLRNPAMDAAVEEMCDVGVIHCVSAGNMKTAAFGSGSADEEDWDISLSSSHYDDYYEWGVDVQNGAIPAGTKRYYHRGSSPLCNKSIYISGLNYEELHSSGDGHYPHQFALGSTKGTRTDIACSFGSYNNIGYDAGFSGFHSLEWTSSFNGSTIPTRFGMGSNGTSFSNPIATGVIALYLQVNPTANSATIKKWLKKHASEVAGDTSLDRIGHEEPWTPGNPNTYYFIDGQPAANQFTTRSGDLGIPTLGCPSKIALYNPFNSKFPSQTTGSLTFSGINLKTN